MIEAIQVAAMDPAMAGQAGPQGTGGLSHATPYDVRDFAAALERSGGASGPQQVGGTPQVADITPAQPSEGTRALIEAINNLNTGADNINALSRSMSGNIAELTPGQMMEMTMKCHQFLFQAELTSNVANRTSDGIQQLFRQQS
ncbi:hypothetical protein GCM10007164_22820 [Luteimonas padinae]|uniref:EscI/YscI/HrpB family type III secretion system inner rod protein n=2 Tax=Luteimonas TaxID=83614 RepID=A0ABV6SWX3_9GAMM|nr:MULTISPECIES: EscI/YscI/HrpB family type III secretion system inner rod protein [Luteimonas]MBD7987316.1 hypothetical protein [Luteimonas colneyensis]GHD73497.1 hypothetical protein GCM10007164_22820 [Luteimonas padinae]